MEQRITDALHSYWNKIRAEQPFPSESAINSDDISAIWANCFLVRVEDGKKFAYDYLGESIIEAYADSKLGEDIIEDQLYPENPGILNKFRDVLNSKEPVFYEGEFVNKNNLDIKFRKILLPIGDNGKVEYILGGMRWKSI